jgi:hypothetical protein
MIAAGANAGTTFIDGGMDALFGFAGTAAATQLSPKPRNQAYFTPFAAFCQCCNDPVSANVFHASCAQR